MKDKPFFVGYLNMPAALKKFYWPLVIMLIVFTGFAGYSLASLQKGVGPGVWQTTKLETIVGYLTVDPYPVLHRIDPNDPAQIQSVLLVNQGKFSAEAVSASHQNSWVSITGVPIIRGGWTMLEVGSSDNFVSSNPDDAALLQKVRDGVIEHSLGPVELTGEIADSKCFLGVMKPGEGSVHKACAEVCLIGGMPAMLIVRGDDQLKYGYLLVQPDGAAASSMVAEKAAEQLTVSGELTRKGDLLYLKMSG